MNDNLFKSQSRHCSQKEGSDTPTNTWPQMVQRSFSIVTNKVTYKGSEKRPTHGTVVSRLQSKSFDDGRSEDCLRRAIRMKEFPSKQVSFSIAFCFSSSVNVAFMTLRYPADLCLTDLQISTNQCTTRKQLWGSIHSRAFRETKGIQAFEWFLSCLVRRLFCFACWEFCDTPGRFVRHRIYYKLKQEP